VKRTRLLTALAVTASVTVGAPFAAAEHPAAPAPLLRVLALAASTAAHDRTELTGALSNSDRLVGVTWRTGAPQVRYRWHTAGGWRAWQTAESDALAPTWAERRHARPGTEPLWRPNGTDRVEVAVTAQRGPVTGVRLLAVGDAPRSLLGRVVAALQPRTAVAAAATTVPHLGAVRTRADWGADESLRRCGPSYASRVRAVVVHHTDQPNNYTAADVPALIRADYAYHVEGRGWCDLGYNLVVDRFGRIWQGRAGGVTRAVIGAHAEGFNTGTLGVAFLGNTDALTPSRTALRALARVGSFAAATWRFRPRSTVVLTSGGSPRYRAGVRVRLPRIIGHRDVGLTDCPGRHLYADLGRIRRLATGVDLRPHFTTTAVHGDPVHVPTPLSVELGLDRRAHWWVSLWDATGVRIAHAHGRGRRAQLTWDGLVDIAGTGVDAPALPQELTWTAAAHNPWGRAHRSGSVDVGLPLV
jgi:N-acetylmuramoyl-L-alanine amidase